mgnify:CR=1 FL=1
MKPVERRLLNLSPAAQAQLAARGWRDRQDDEYPLTTKDCRPARYRHDLQRGTVRFDPDWRNYSFHRVLIPAGTVVRPDARGRSYNFSQAAPRTAAIVVEGIQPSGTPPLTLIACNLVNVAIDLGWVIEGGNTAQSWLIVGDDGDEEREYLVDHPSKLPAELTQPARAFIQRAQQLANLRARRDSIVMRRPELVEDIDGQIARLQDLVDDDARA